MAVEADAEHQSSDELEGVEAASPALIIVALVVPLLVFALALAALFGLRPPGAGRHTAARASAPTVVISVQEPAPEPASTPFVLRSPSAIIFSTVTPVPNSPAALAATKPVCVTLATGLRRSGIPLSDGLLAILDQEHPECP